jgi:hypothetical protein
MRRSQDRSRRRRLAFTALAFALAAQLAGRTAGAQPIELILKVGDVAPGFPGGTTIASFVEPPSISDSGYAVFHVTVTGGVHAIYRWHRLVNGVWLVAKGTDSLAFATGNKTLSFLETPIADDDGWVAFTATLSDGARGMAVWEPFVGLHAVAEVGQTVDIPCEKTDGSPCTVNPVVGTLGSMATFGDRKGAIFRLHENGSVQHEILFRGFVVTSGSPDALWRWVYDESGPTTSFESLASDFVHVPGGSTTSYYDGFTDLAACGDQRFGLTPVAASPDYAVVEFDPSGSGHFLLDRANAPDMVARKDFHCYDGSYAYAGGRTGGDPFDGDATKKGVWLDATQVYSNTVTPAAGLFETTLGTPTGQALTRDDPPSSVFAANLIGGSWNGRAGVWRGTGPGDLEKLLHELQVFFAPNDAVDLIWTVHVGGTGAVGFHALMTSGDQAILREKNGERERVLVEGDEIPGVGTIDSFWTLGGTFGSDPVVTGTGADGHVSALNANGDFVLLIYFKPTPAASPVPGWFLVGLDTLIFYDGFEVQSYCLWSFVSGGTTDCP